MRAPHCPCGVRAHCVRFSARWSLPARGTEARPQEKVRMNQQELPRKDQSHSLNCMPEVLHRGRKRNHTKIKCSHALVYIRVTCQCKSLWHCGLSDEYRFVWQRCSTVLAFVHFNLIYSVVPWSSGLLVPEHYAKSCNLSALKVLTVRFGETG